MHLVRIALGLVVALCAAEATEYFVATTGNDANPGTLASPFLSPQRGVDAATQAGDIVTFRGGTYTVAQTVYCANSGGAGSPITYRGSPGETVILRAADVGTDVVTVKGSHLVYFHLTTRDGEVGIRFDVTIDAQNLVVANANDVLIDDCAAIANHGWAGIAVQCSGGAANHVPPGDHITIRRCLLKDNGETDHHHGVYINGGRNILIEDCTVVGNSGFGLHFYGDRYADYPDLVEGGSGVIVRRNRIYGNGFRGNDGCGIVFSMGESRMLTADQGWSDVLVEDNFLYDNRSYGIEIETWGNPPIAATRNATLRNNSCYRNRIGQAYIGFSSSVTFANNLLSRGGLDVDDIEVTQQATSPRIDANFYEGPDAASFVLPGNRSVAFAGWRAGGFDARGFQGDAALVDRNAPDLHLGSTSQAIDRGAGDAGLFASEDIDGRPRPNGNAVDMGADEYESAAGGVPAITSPVPGATLSSSSVTFQWTAASGATGYWLYVGTTPGGRDLFNQNEGMRQSATVSGLPTGGRALYVRLWYLISGVWRFTDATFTAASAQAPVVRIASSAITLSWDGSASRYWLHVGTTVGGRDLFNQDEGMSRSATLNGLPPGTTVYVRLWYLVGAEWRYADSSYATAR